MQARHPTLGDPTPYLDAAEETALASLSQTPRPPKPALSPGLCAARDGDLASLKALYEAGQWRLDEKDRHGSEAVHWAAGGGHIPILRWLVALGSEKEEKTCLVTPCFKSRRRDGRQPIHWACRNGELATLSFLLEHDVDPRTRTFDGTTPIHLAAFGGHLDCCKRLREAFRGLMAPGDELALKDKNDWGCDIVHWAAMGGHVPILQWLHGLCLDFLHPQQEGHTVLHKAAQRGHDEALRWLLEFPLASSEARCKASAPDTAGFTPAEIAHAAGHETTARLLADAGC